MARPVRGEPIGIVRAQCDLLCRQLAPSSHDLEHGLRPGLASDDQAVDFTGFIAWAAAEIVACETRHRCAENLLANSSREARFTVSPMTVKLIMNSEPMLPTRASPVAMPMRRSHSVGIVRTEQLGQFFAQAADATHHVDGGEAGEACFIGFVGERRSPISHDGVADIFVDDPLLAPDWLRHGRQIAVHHLDESLWRHAFAQARKAFHVAEHDRHHPTLTFGGRRRLIDEAFDHARVDVAAKRPRDLLLVTQLADHAIECSRQLTDLIAGDDIDGSIELACLDVARALQQQPDRARDPAADQACK